MTMPFAAAFILKQSGGKSKLFCQHLEVDQRVVTDKQHGVPQIFFGAGIRLSRIKKQTAFYAAALSSYVSCPSNDK